MGFLIEKILTQNEFPLGDNKLKMKIKGLDSSRRNILMGIIKQLFNKNNDDIFDQSEQAEFKKVITSKRITGIEPKKTNKKSVPKDITITVEKLEKLYQFFIVRISPVLISKMQNPDNTANARIKTAKRLAKYYKECAEPASKKEIMWAFIRALKQDKDVSVRRTIIKQLSYIAIKEQNRIPILTARLKTESDPFARITLLNSLYFIYNSGIKDAKYRNIVKFAIAEAQKNDPHEKVKQRAEKIFQLIEPPPPAVESSKSSQAAEKPAAPVNVKPPAPMPTPVEEAKPPKPRKEPPKSATAWSKLAAAAARRAAREAAQGIFSIRWGDRFGKSVALTFDDGPSPQNTPDILNILKKYGISATFFVKGEVVAQNAELIKRILKEGHTLGNHTFHHYYATRLSGEELKKEIEKTQKAVNDVIAADEELKAMYPKGYLMRQFRPPYGRYNNDVMKTAKAAGYDEFVVWTVSSDDCRNPGDAAIKRNVMTNARGTGGVILFHDSQPFSKSCLEDIIKSLTAEDYKFMAVDDLMVKKYGKMFKRRG